MVLTYRTNDNLVYTKVGLETKNVADFEELTLRAGDREMTVNYGLDGARGAEYTHRYRVFPSIKSIEVIDLESSYFIGDSLKSVSGKTAEIKVTYVTYRSADVNLETGEYTETLEPQSYHMFEDGNLFYRITAEGFSTATAGVFTMTLKYVEELTDDTGVVVHSLQSSIDFDYVVRERDIEKSNSPATSLTQTEDTFSPTTLRPQPAAISLSLNTPKPTTANICKQSISSKACRANTL